jgi:hypothetical protein
MHRPVQGDVRYRRYRLAHLVTAPCVVFRRHEGAVRLTRAIRS